MSHYTNAENHFKSITSKNELEFIEIQFGLDMRIYKPPQPDEFDDAYDTMNDFHISDASEVIDIRGVLESDDLFRPNTRESAVQFENGFLYTSNPYDITTDDVLEVQRFDGKKIYYVIKQRESLGVTDEFFYRYVLEAISNKG